MHLPELSARLGGPLRKLRRSHDICAAADREVAEHVPHPVPEPVPEIGDDVVHGTSGEVE